MKKQLYITFFLLVGSLQAQTALYNAGNIRIHPNGQLGFHTDLINNASFDQNAGLAGFYGSTTLNVSGAFMPVFFDTEIVNPNGVLLSTGLSVTNNANFVVGDFISPKDQMDVYFNFFQDAFATGAADNTKVDGFAALTNKQTFSFPVGDAQQLRPLILNSESVNAFAKCAYFFEDPNNPSAFPEIFDTTRKIRDIGNISTFEFWRLEGSVPSTVTLSWNTRSNLPAVADDVLNVIIVGWNKSARRWLELGNIAIGGDLDLGFVTSEPFTPEEYDIITFGTVAVPTEILTLDNYLLTPNGDGVNDVLVIQELIDLSPNNSLKIFDRNGLQVFDMINYSNEFDGTSNMDNLVINRDAGLPEGVYFYLIFMDDLDLEFQGFLYLDR
ncbi:gliding motility-associated C-terminal domain-containing protein [Spongiimicrobium sp. 2-473A-2-J]|uniref:gliding motility-associated C-terminal domain-containing protein n=1 Tax=Eudoraea algarum TaxID=3417568 RepID=UPI003D36ADA4